MEQTFLEHVAKDILTKYGTDLSRTAVVFPNKRAALFLNGHLARLCGNPLWSPAYITISDLFRQQSERTVADSIKLVCDLYQSFKQQTGIDETLDHFFGWGQTLLSDFDDIDKNLADADKVFANLRDIHELDSVVYLTEEQKEIIRKFFSNFSPDHNTLLKERFLRLWSRMGDIYHDFNQRIASQGLAYEGALYREVACSLQAEPFSSHERYLFVGFNLLLPVERRLFSFLRSEGKAHFYWDFDHYYTRLHAQHEAGHFINQQLSEFPNELDSTDAAVYNCFARPKHLTFIAAPTENIQARYIPQWLQAQHPTGDNPHAPDTAIVLCNENLLQTVVHCLPPEVSKVNITTGYPLVQTPVAALITLLIDLRTNGYATQRERFRLHHVNAVLRHPYVTPLSDAIPTLLERLNVNKIYYSSAGELSVDDVTKLIFRELDGSNASLLRWLCDIMQSVATNHSALNPSPLLQESIFRAYTLLNRLLSLVESGDLTVDIITLQRLITQLVQTTSIPFHGEPAEGLQVMGVLETRNLDFSHLLLLSCNEGNLPRGINDASFIPYNIRKAYSLTTSDHKVAIYSYYFHRLLQRADDVTIIYNNSTSDGQRGEMSRFMLQLMVESPHHIEFRTLQAPQEHTPFRPPTIAKTPEVIQRLMEHFTPEEPTADTSPAKPLLTPTAVNRYLRCPLIFYYTYVHNLREPDTTDDDVIDNRIFGNIFHEAARIIYQRLMQKSRRILADDIHALLKGKVDIIRAVDEAFQKELFHTASGMQQAALNGLQIINREVIIHYLRQLLQIDSQLAPFTIIGLECDVVVPFTTSPPTPLQTTIGGRIDRLDCIDENGQQRIRVIDYKTGSHRLQPFADVDAVFRQENLKNHNDYYLQAMLYACLVKREHPESSVSPALLFIQHAGSEDYDPILAFKDGGRIDDIATYSERFGELLRGTIDEMFSPDVPFAPTTDRSRCTNCPYKHLCSTGQ